MRWMKNGYWKLISGEMWYYKGFRTNCANANRAAYNMHWGTNLIGLKQYAPDKGVYEIFVRPRE